MFANSEGICRICCVKSPELSLLTYAISTEIMCNKYQYHIAKLYNEKDMERNWLAFQELRLNSMISRYETRLIIHNTKQIKAEQVSLGVHYM